MKKILLSVALIGGIANLSAQDLPQPSPKATLEQRVGLTDFTIEYSRPSVKDREIFGELVPYGKMWRTGANANTTFETSSDVTIGGKLVPAGKYSLFTVPGKDNWVVIFNNKNDHGGTVGYSKERDVVRVEVKPTTITPVETFRIDINNIDGGNADLVLQWDKTSVAVPMQVEVQELALGNIETAISESEDDNKWSVYRNAANYYHNNNMDADKALEYINKSIEANDDSWYSHWLKAEILAEKGMYDEAIESAEKAKEVGMKDAETKGSEFGYHEMIDAGIDSWEAKK